MIVAIMALFHVAGFVSSILAVMKTRTAQGSIAWAISLNTFPYLAVPLYWVLGRSKFEGYVIARRTSDLHHDGIEQQVVETVERYRVQPNARPASVLAAERLARLPILGGNRVDVLVDGEATFGSILSGIGAARDYVLVQFFIIRDDGLGRALSDRLLSCAARGVRVFFVYDEIGSQDLSGRYIRELRDGGVEIHDFNTQKGHRNRFQINFRNHRKVVVVDGKVAWIGGHNVGDEYLGRDPKVGRWRDTHVRIEGPAALMAQISFVEDWFWATDTYPTLNWTGTAAADGRDSPVLILPSGPADEVETTTLMFLHAISSAQERIWIASPYFVPDESIITALQLAGLRGVDVRILIPDQPDHLLVYLAAFSYFDRVGKTGVKFYRYQDGFLHEKVMLIDHETVTVGTANFDNRSFRLNFEITAVIADPGSVHAIESMFEDDFRQSRLMEEGELGQKPWWFQFGVRLARLTAPIQ